MSNGDALALPAREPNPVVAERCIESFWEVVEKFRYLRRLENVTNFIFRYITVSEYNVILKFIVKHISIFPNN